MISNSTDLISKYDRHLNVKNMIYPNTERKSSYLDLKNKFTDDYK